MAVEFRPKRSFGWFWLVALAALLLGQPILVLSASKNPLPALMWLVEAGILGLGLWFLMLAALFPSMRYEVTCDELVLRYGPMHWSVPLAQIREVKRTDLAWTVWSSMRFPGFALFKVPYAGLGNVRMCATRSARGILLIQTDVARYGVTPEDEAGFTGAITTASPSLPAEGKGS